MKFVSTKIHAHKKKIKTSYDTAVVVRPRVLCREESDKMLL